MITSEPKGPVSLDAGSGLATCATSVSKVRGHAFCKRLLCGIAAPCAACCLNMELRPTLGSLQNWVSRIATRKSLGELAGRELVESMNCHLGLNPSPKFDMSQTEECVGCVLADSEACQCKSKITFETLVQSQMFRGDVG